MSSMGHMAEKGALQILTLSVVNEHEVMGVTGIGIHEQHIMKNSAL